MDGFVPLHVQIEVTWKCSWRCVHCYQDNHASQVFSLDRLKSLFGELKESGTMHLIVTGGEPMARLDIFEILESARFNGMAITLYSNAHLINKPIARRLSALIGVTEISLLAGEANLHDQLARSPGSFQKTLQAIHFLTNHDIKIIVKTPILKPAYPTLKALENLLKSLEIAWHADIEISRTYSGNLNPLQYKLGPSELSRFFSDFPQFNPQTNINNADPGALGGTCLAARNFCFIDALGNVYPCLNFKSACDVLENQGMAAEAKLGNVLSVPFQEIWKSSQFALRLRSVTAENFTVCANCKANAGCRQCMALNYETHGDLFKPSPVTCNVTRTAAKMFDQLFTPASELSSAV
ncbi:MAG: radical SAM protein [Elusimicrobia bacterium]|nr:radical SAM protein [Elusimicrobiota bacterium]